MHSSVGGGAHLDVRNELFGLPVRAAKEDEMLQLQVIDFVPSRLILELVKFLMLEGRLAVLDLLRERLHEFCVFQFDSACGLFGASVAPVQARCLFALDVEAEKVERAVPDAQVRLSEEGGVRVIIGARSMCGRGRPSQANT